MHKTLCLAWRQGSDSPSSFLFLEVRSLFGSIGSREKDKIYEARVVLPMATVCSLFGDLSDPNFFSRKALQDPPTEAQQPENIGGI